MQENNNSHQVENKEISTEQIELMRKAAISCDKAARSIEEMIHEFSNFYNGTISGVIFPDDIDELKVQLNPIAERYKAAVSKSMKYFDSFQFGNHDSYKNAASKSGDWFPLREPKSLTTEQIDAIVEAWNKYDIADEQYDRKVK